jgi:hypothetical protein
MGNYWPIRRADLYVGPTAFGPPANTLPHGAERHVESYFCRDRKYALNDSIWLADR